AAAGDRGDRRFRAVGPAGVTGASGSLSPAGSARHVGNDRRRFRPRVHLSRGRVRMTPLSLIARCAGILCRAGLPLVTVLAPLAAQSPGGSGYHLARQIRLGGDGRWDYIVFDTAAHRLFIARQTRVMVVDPESGKLLGEIPGLDGAHGVALVNETGRGFATSGRDSSVTMFDLKTLRVLGRIKAAEDADAVLYDPASKHVLTFNGDAGSSTVIDPVSGKAIGAIALGGKPEFGVSAGDGKVYVNLEDRRGSRRSMRWGCG